MSEFYCFINANKPSPLVIVLIYYYYYHRIRTSGAGGGRYNNNIITMFHCSSRLAAVSEHLLIYLYANETGESLVVFFIFFLNIFSRQIRHVRVNGFNET